MPIGELHGADTAHRPAAMVAGGVIAYVCHFSAGGAGAVFLQMLAQLIRGPDQKVGVRDFHHAPVVFRQISWRVAGKTPHVAVIW
jgi:hypothetical protein